MKKRPGFVGPLLLLSAGFILLFNNLGLVRWDTWGSLWRYWPVILILFGIQILAKNAESGVMYFMAVFLSILVTSGTIFLAWNGYPPQDRIGKKPGGAVFNNSHLEYEDFDFANLENADLSNSNIDGVDMNFANMRNANFSNSSINGANLNFANFQNANFNNAGMRGTNLNFANMQNTDLRNADLNGSNLNFANLEGANMAGAQIAGASHVFTGTSKSTICPDSRYGPCW